MIMLSLKEVNMKYKHPTEILRSNIEMDWIGDRIPCASKYVRGDTHPLTWAADNEIYVGTGDPNWMPTNNGNRIARGSTSKEVDDEEYRRTSGLVVEKFTGKPSDFYLTRVNDMPGFIGHGGSGPKPTGMISVDGKLYFAVQNLLGWKPPRFRENSQHGSDATILCSENFGQTWEPDLNDLLSEMEAEQYIRNNRENTEWRGWKTSPQDRSGYKGWEPMFPGHLFGGPSFVQFGKDNDMAKDDYIYAVSADHWDNGSEMRLGRVHKSSVLSAAEWEFANTSGNGDVEWNKNLSESKPVLEIEGHISVPEMVYIPTIDKYLLFTWALHQDFRATPGSELTVLEADNMWGPYRLVYYEWMWYKREAGCYCPRLPLKWFDMDNLTGWLEFSGNWETQVPYYLPQVRPFSLKIT